MGFKAYYINESSHTPMTWNEVEERIQIDCKPFLKENVRVYRGMDVKKKGMAGKHKVRQDRRPLDTPQSYDNFMEVYLQSIKAPSRRKSVFGTLDEREAMRYGRIYSIYPIGKYESFYFNTVRDAMHLSAGFDRIREIAWAKWIINKQDPPSKYFDHEFVTGFITDAFRKTKSIKKSVDMFIDMFEKELNEKGISIGKDAESIAEIYDKILYELEDYTLNGKLANAGTSEITIQCKEYYYLGGF